MRRLPLLTHILLRPFRFAFLGLLVAVGAFFSLQPDSTDSAEPETSLLELDALLPQRQPIYTYIRRLPGLLILGILGFLFLQEISGGWFKNQFIISLSIHLQFMLLLAVLVVFAAGLNGQRRLAFDRAGFVAFVRRHRYTLFPLLLVTLLAFFLRFWHLDDAARFLINENLGIPAVYSIRRGEPLGLFAPYTHVAPFPYIYPYLQTVAQDWMGRGLLSLRAVSALFGTLTVPALFFLAYELFDRPTAWFAALLLAVFPPHLQFSRIGLNPVVAPFFGTLALAFVVRALRHEGRADYVLAGVLLGLTHYFYDGDGLFFTLLAIAWIALAVVLEQSSEAASLLTTDLLGKLRRGILVRQSHLLTALVGLLVIAMPVYYTRVGLGLPLTPAPGVNQNVLPGLFWPGVSLLDTLSAYLSDQLLSVLPFFAGSGLSYVGSIPFVTPLFILLFLLGAGTALRRWRQSVYLLPLLWLFGGLISGVVVVLPALVLLAALGLNTAVTFLLRRTSMRRLALMLVVALLAVTQINDFFNQFLPLYNTAFRAEDLAPDGYDAAWRSLDFPVGTQIRIISDPQFDRVKAGDLISAFRTGLRVDTILPKQLTGDYLLNLACNVDHAFFLQSSDAASLRAIRRYFRLLSPQPSPYADIAPDEQFVLYYAPYTPEEPSIFNRRCSITDPVG
ncbi:MAG: glycosyltransferase family 39 protein [Anaerolineae bacterium]